MISPRTFRTLRYLLLLFHAKCPSWFRLRLKIPGLKKKLLVSLKMSEKNAIAAANAVHVASDFQKELESSEKKSICLSTALQKAKTALADPVDIVLKKTALDETAKLELQDVWTRLCTDFKSYRC